MRETLGELTRPAARRTSALAALTLAVIALDAGEALATHVRCGDVVTQDTTLDSDLIDCAGDGIVIGADNVALDLAGHTIDGALGTSGAGVDNTGFSEDPTAGFDTVIVAGGVIQEFHEGVAIQGGRDNEVRQLTLQDNSLHIRAWFSDGSLIRGNTASPTGSTPLGTGISVIGSPHARVEQNSVFGGAARDQIFVSACDHCVVDRNATDRNITAIQSVDMQLTRNSGAILVLLFESLIGENRARGIDVIGGRANTITGNSSSGERFGILLNFTIDNHVYRNRLSGNAFSGIGIVVQSRGNRIERNRILGNALNGISLSGARSNRIEGNRVWNNEGSGIHWNNDQGAPNPAAELVVQDNVLFGHDDGGITVRGSDIRGSIVGNRAHRNGDDGIDAASQSVVLASNKANSNRDLGIEASPGVIDGGGNKASGNGNPAQCVNVTCK